MLAVVWKFTCYCVVVMEITLLDSHSVCHVKHVVLNSLYCLSSSACIAAVHTRRLKKWWYHEH